MGVVFGTLALCGIGGAAALAAYRMALEVVREGTCPEGPPMAPYKRPRFVDLRDIVVQDAPSPQPDPVVVSEPPTLSAPPEKSPETPSQNPVSEPSIDEGWDCIEIANGKVVVNPLARYLKVPFENKFHLGVVGGQGAGKTALCGAFRAIVRQLREDDRDPKDVPDFTRRIALRAMRQFMDPAIHGPCVEDDKRDPTPWVLDNLVLWDICGGGVERATHDEYIEQSGLAFMSCVLVVVGLYDTAVVNRIVRALHQSQIPMILVQSHIDEYLREEYLRDASRAVASSQPVPRWTQEHIRDVMQQRAAYLRTTYALDERDGVMMVNSTPYLLEAKTTEQHLAADAYDLYACVTSAMVMAKRAHHPKSE